MERRDILPSNTSLCFLRGDEVSVRLTLSVGFLDEGMTEIVRILSLFHSIDDPS